MGEEMFNLLYTMIGSLEILLFLILISKYIYLEKSFECYKGWFIFIAIFMICEFGVNIWNPNGDFSAFLPFCFFIIYIFITREKHKMKGILLVLPISGMMCPFMTIPTSFLYLFSKSMNSILDADKSWYGILDVIFWVCFILFIWRGKQWRTRFEEIAQNRSLAKWERNLLNGTGLFLLLFSFLVLCVDELKVASLYAKCFVGFVIQL